MKILVCDDSAVARKAIISHLTSSNEVDISETSDGLQAMSVLKKEEFDLVLLDLTMPKFDGYQVLNAIHRDNAISYRPKIIVISGDIQKEAIKKCLALGANTFLSKPFVFQQLKNAFSQVGFESCINTITPSLEQHASHEETLLEGCNIVLGKSTALLAEHLGQWISMPVPSVFSFEVDDFLEEAIALPDHNNSHRVSQRFVGGKIHGEALVCVSGEGLEDFAEKMGYNEEYTSKNETLLNLSNLLISTFVKHFGQLLSQPFSLRQPEIYSGPINIETDNSQLFAISFEYTIDALHIKVVVCIDQFSLDKLYQLLRGGNLERE
ncbi:MULTISPECIES: response regulator [unclassified Vibrio]|uniref:Response regulator n=1 Tax=Vibrio sp. HB236076 TaxID=3232307 RepID=A0AB39HBB2_9VIBR|nr:response regulator [Vibrio sp. HB161653]MDP5253422.1 response regulator [Vibrio sp. HB161653]